MLALYPAVLFLSAALLFVVQPLFGRLALPVLGGAPSVWATTLVFFQTALLAGYLYAHLLQRLPLRRQPWVHLALYAGGAAFLPLALRTGAPPAEGLPALWLLGALTASVAVPFVILSAHAPLLQRWYVGSRPDADPYPLYAASNAGSLLGLLSYPFVLEPLLDLRVHGRVWTAGYALLGLGLVACAAALARSPPRARDARTHAPAGAAGAPGAPAAPLAWIAYAAVPSALLVTVTTHLTTDLAAWPMMWVPPLALYLGSYIVAFASRPVVSHGAALRLAVVAVVVLAALIFAVPVRTALAFTVAVLACFFVVALALHGELVARRPAPAQLTRFYLAMSLGGALGGASAALLPPLLFDGAPERPLLLLVAAALLALANARLPSAHGAFSNGWLGPLGRIGRPRTRTLAFVSGCGLLAVAFVYARGNLDGWREYALAGPAIVLLMVAPWFARRHALRLVAAVASILAALGGQQLLAGESAAWRGRSFFGAYRVVDYAAWRVLLHGTTVHGAQSHTGDARRVPAAYYGPTSGIGLVLDRSPAEDVGIVGLGTGATACWAQPGQRWTFFEIDPLMVHVARDAGLFTYLRDCVPDARIVLGDARLTLEREPDGAFDVLAVDAFSSDAIPLHLLTAEAFELYARRLAPGGVLLVHVSNRHLDLLPVLAAVSRAQGWYMYVRKDAPEERPGIYQTSSTWVWMSKDGAPVTWRAGEKPEKAWEEYREEVRVRMWTDGYANPLAVLKVWR